MARANRYPYIMSGVLEAWDWFDNGLQNLVKAGGFKPLNKSQSMMVLYVSAGVTRPIEIARKMRLSRQAIRHIANQLVAMDIVSVADDPTDGRSVVLSFTQKSSAIRSFAQMSIHDLEKTLRARLGTDNAQTLRNILELDWGPTIKSVHDLEPGSLVAAHIKIGPKPQTKKKRAK